jgi:hypothetical protein
MAVHVTTRSAITLGRPAIVEGPAPGGSFTAVFEDDQDTGYFYVLDTSSGGNAIQEALHLYNVTTMTDKLKPSVIEIGWSSDSTKCVLFIDGDPYAVFDFETKRGYCRSGLPASASSAWSSQTNACREALSRLFNTELH